MAIITNEMAQKVFKNAMDHLLTFIEGEDREDTTKLNLVYSYLETIQVYSKSGNSIPGFSGQGLQEAYALAESVLKNRPMKDRDVTIGSYKNIPLSIEIGNGSLQLYKDTIEDVYGDPEIEELWESLTEEEWNYAMDLLYPSGENRPPKAMEDSQAVELTLKHFGKLTTE